MLGIMDQLTLFDNEPGYRENKFTCVYLGEYIGSVSQYDIDMFRLHKPDDMETKFIPMTKTYPIRIPAMAFA